MVSIAAFGGIAFAGWRPPTAEEQAFHVSTLRTIAAAVPGCPAGWRMTSRTEARALEEVPTGTEKAAFRVDYAMVCVDVARKNAGEQKAVEAMTARVREQEKDPRVDALNRERRRIAEAIGQAAGRGDMAAMERLSKELDGVEAKLKPILDGYSRETEAVRAANEARDTELAVAVEVNTFYEALELLSAAEPVGGHAVYRAGERHYVFLGKGLRMTTANGMSVLKRAAAGVKPAYPAAQLIQVKVEADPARARQFLQSIDWKALDGMIR